MTDELKPCPFCGSPARLNRSTGESLWSHDQVEWTQVQCTNEDCGVATENHCEGWEPTPIESWNSRALSASQPAQAGEVDERVAFEAWASRQSWFIPFMTRRRDMAGSTRFVQYVDPDMQAGWQAWQARASLPTQPAAQPAPMTWPKARDIGRFGDMHPADHLRVGLDSDNDVYVSVWGEKGGASVEFCNPGGGGGGSSKRTREALIALMVAMEADNADRPDKDWWARRTAQAKGGEA